MGADDLHENDGRTRRSNQQGVELFSKIDIVNSLRGRDHTLVSLLIHEDAIDRIVKIEFVETRSGFALQQVGIVIPKVKIAIIYSQQGIIETTLDG